MKTKRNMLTLAFGVALAVLMIPAISLFADAGFASDFGSVYAATQENDADNGEAVVTATDKDVVQLVAGETVDIDSCAQLTIGGEKSDKIRWEIIGEASEDGSADVLEYTDATGRVLKANAPGAADVWAYAEDNYEVGVLFRVEVYATAEELANANAESEAAGAVVSEDATADDDVNLRGVMRGEPVAKLTIIAYPGSKTRWMPHGFLALQTYEDLKMNVSFHTRYTPTDEYNNLMRDCMEHPEKYSSDPALYNNNDLGLVDRESYFEEKVNGDFSDPEEVSLKAGESITISNFAHDEFDMPTVIYILENSSVKTSKETAELIKQLKNYAEDNGQFDLAKALSGGIVTFVKAYRTMLRTGYNPLDGLCKDGGLFINNELRAQFISNIARLPNNYYTVEITADELASLEAVISNPENNYFSFLNRNCTGGATSIWNAALYDRPELQMKANYTGFAIDPESLYVELGLLRAKRHLDGHGGRDFSPRTLAFGEGFTKEDIPKNAKPKTRVSTLKVFGKTITVKRTKVRKRGQSFLRSKVITVQDSKGTLTFKKLAGQSKIKINEDTGKVTVKKGLKKGIYKVKVQVADTGNNLFEAGAKIVVFKVIVK